MKITKLAIAIGTALVLSAGLASADKHEEPPKFDFLCSPGYYKGHLEWTTSLGLDQTTIDALLWDLNATGQTHSKPGQHMQNAAAFINSLYISQTGDIPCEDGDPVE